MTNASNGTVLERYTYDHFGKRTILAPDGSTVRSSSSYNVPFGYTSREHDPETGLMYFRARYYDPHTAEFTSPDPLEYVDGMSLFRGYFVPLHVDPIGLSICKCTTTTMITGSCGGGGIITNTDFIYTKGACSSLDYSNIHITGNGSKRTCSGSLSNDETKASGLCGGDPACEKWMSDLMNRVKNTDSGVWSPYWLDDRGYCFKYLERIQESMKNCKEPPKHCTIEFLTVFPKPEKIDPTSGVVPTYSSPMPWGKKWGWSSHGVVRICCSKGEEKKCMYFDVGSESWTGQYGGDDKWFSPDDPNFLDEIDPDVTIPWVK